MAVYFGLVLIWSLNPAEVKAKEAQIAHEFEQIPIMPASIFFSESGIARSDRIHKGKSFVIQATFEEIYHFYDVELQKLGWKFIEQKPLLLWGKDYGSECVSYTKEDLELSLTYMGDAPNYTIDYSLDISWYITSSSGCP